MVDVKELLRHMPVMVSALCADGRLDDESVRRLELAIDSPDILNYKLSLLAKDLVLEILEIEQRCRALRGTLVASELLWRSRGRSGNLLNDLDKARTARRDELAGVCRALIQRAPVRERSATREEKDRRALMQAVLLEIRTMRAVYLREGAPKQHFLPFDGDEWRKMQNEAIWKELARDPFGVTDEMVSYFDQKSP